MLLADAVQGWIDDNDIELPIERQAFARSLATRLRSSSHATVQVDQLEPTDIGTIAATFLEHERDEVGALLHAARGWGLSKLDATGRPGTTTPRSGPVAGTVAPAAGWWQASDDNWYPPEDHPDLRSATPTVPAPPAPVAPPDPIRPPVASASAPPNGGTDPAAAPPAADALPPLPPELRPGWWQASDNNWYPPEDHPDRRVVAPVSTPAERAVAQAPPAPPAGVRATGSRSRGRARGLLIGAAATIAIAAGAIVALAAGSGDEAAVDPLDVSTRVAEPTVEPRPTTRPTPAAAATPSDTAGSASGTLGGAATAGTRSNPFPTDTPTLIRFETFGDAEGSVWEITIGETADITEEVIAANVYNEAPPDEVRFVGFPVRMTLLDGRSEPLSPDFTLTWNIIGGATNAVYDSTTIDTPSYGCGVVPDEFETFAAAAIGGTLEGTICIPLPEADLDHPDTMAGFELSGGEHLAFSRDGTATTRVDRPSAVFGDRFATEPGSLGDPHAYGETVDVFVEGYSDAVGSRWEVTVEAPRDITDLVLAENEFNDPPPDGVRFVGVDITMRLADAVEEPLEPGSGAIWEIVGGSTRLVYERYADLTGISGCGVVPGELDTYDEVFEGGTVSGTLCVPLPAADLDAPTTRVALYWTGSLSRVGWGPPD